MNIRKDYKKVFVLFYYSIVIFSLIILQIPKKNHSPYQRNHYHIQLLWTLSTIQRDTVDSIRYYEPNDEAIILARWRGSFNEPATVLNWFKTG